MTSVYCPVSLAKVVLLHTPGYHLISTEYVYIQLMILLDIAPFSVLHVASYWRLILIECLRCWLVHGASVAIDRYMVIMGHCGGDVCVCTYGSQ